MPSNRPDYDRQYWLKHGHQRTLRVRLAECEAALVAIMEGVPLKDFGQSHDPTCLMCFEIARRALEKADNP